VLNRNNLRKGSFSLDFYHSGLLEQLRLKRLKYKFQNQISGLAGYEFDLYQLLFGLRFPNWTAQGAFFVTVSPSLRHQTAAKVRQLPDPSKSAFFGKSASGQRKSQKRRRADPTPAFGESLHTGGLLHPVKNPAALLASEDHLVLPALFAVGRGELGETAQADVVLHRNDGPFEFGVQTLIGAQESGVDAFGDVISGLLQLGAAFHGKSHFLFPLLRLLQHQVQILVQNQQFDRDTGHSFSLPGKS
jgi:hypothetical protein